MGAQTLWAELCPPKPTAALTPQVTAFGDEAFKEVLRLNEVMGGAMIHESPGVSHRGKAL